MENYLKGLKIHLCEVGVAVIEFGRNSINRRKGEEELRTKFGFEISLKVIDATPIV